MAARNILLYNSDKNVNFLLLHLLFNHEIVLTIFYNNPTTIQNIKIPAALSTPLLSHKRATKCAVFCYSSCLFEHMKTKVKSIVEITIYTILLLLLIYTTFLRGKRKKPLFPK